MTNPAISMLTGDELGDFLREKIQRLLDIIEELRTLYRTPDHRMEITSYEDELKEMMMLEERKAGLETDKDGKKLYTNDAQRKMRAGQTIKELPNYQETIDNLNAAKDIQYDYDAQKKMLDSEIGIIKAILPALTAIYERETLELKLKETCNVSQRTDNN